MNAGLPGTGIAGIFYFFSIIVLLFSEMWLLLCGRSSKKRWRNVAPTLLITVGMIFAGVLTNFMIIWLVSIYQHHFIQKNAVVGHHSLSIVVHPLLIPVVLLMGVLSVTQVIRIFQKYLISVKKFGEKI